MENKSRKRKRNKKDRGRVKRTTEILRRWANVDNGLDIRDVGLLPEEGRWGEVKSPVTGIKYRVKIAKIRRVR